MLAKLRNLREEHEDGFTLVELLVVILIIGILASIAIPVFLNQRKVANDGAVQSDVKNVATLVETMLVDNPTGYVRGSTSGSPETGSEFRVCVVPDAATIGCALGTGLNTKLSVGVVMNIPSNASSTTNGYTIRAYHTNGKKYINNAGTTTTITTAIYNSATGGLTT